MTIEQITAINNGMSMLTGLYQTASIWLRTFNSWKSAYSFCFTIGRRDWQVK